MRGHLEPDETELRELTDSALGKLQAMSDASLPSWSCTRISTSKNHTKTQRGGLMCRPISIQHEGRTENHAIQS